MNINTKTNLNTPQKKLPISPIPESTAKLKNMVIAIVVLTVIVAVFIYIALKREKTTIFPISTQPSEQTDQKILNDVSKKKERPITVRPLTPIVETDQPSASYKNFISQIDSNSLSEEAINQFSDLILTSDLAIKSRKVDNLNYLFNILYLSDDKAFVLYIMTQTGTACVFRGHMGSDCDDAKLKILNTKDNSINFLTDADIFVEKQGELYLNKKDNSIIIFTGTDYQIFSLSPPYALLKATSDGYSSLLMNEYTISYNQNTFNFVIDNILSGEKIDCDIINTRIKNILKNNFDFFKFFLSPNGNKIILFEGNNKFFWEDLSNQWSSNSPDCLNNAKEAHFSSIKPFSKIGKWYANSNFFAFTDSGHSAFVYDFKAQKQVLFMLWEGDTIGVGYMNNFGYHDVVSLDKSGVKVRVIPGEKQISIFFEMPDGKRYLINKYDDKSSTQAFYELTQKYPINSEGIYTSGRFAHAGFPRTWVRVEKESRQKNLFHLLVLDGYDLRQVLDVSVQP